MRYSSVCVVTMLLHGCGAKVAYAPGTGTGGNGGSGTASGATDAVPTVSDATSSAGMDDAVVYEAMCVNSTNGFFALFVRKRNVDAGFCTMVVFRAPGVDTSEETGIDYPYHGMWEANEPLVVARENCIDEAAEDVGVSLDASGTVWWDDELRFVDVNVTLTLPPDPGWPETDVLQAQGIPVQYHEDCPGPYQGGTGGSGSGG